MGWAASQDPKSWIRFHRSDTDRCSAQFVASDMQERISAVRSPRIFATVMVLVFAHRDTVCHILLGVKVQDEYSREKNTSRQEYGGVTTLQDPSTSHTKPQNCQRLLAGNKTNCHKANSSERAYLSPTACCHRLDGGHGLQGRWAWVLTASTTDIATWASLRKSHPRPSVDLSKIGHYLALSLKVGDGGYSVSIWISDLFLRTWKHRLSFGPVSGPARTLDHSRARLPFQLIGQPIEIKPGNITRQPVKASRDLLHIPSPLLIRLEVAVAIHIATSCVAAWRQVAEKHVHGYADSICRGRGV